jgi:predicted amidohydrolase YtcJ
MQFKIFITLFACIILLATCNNTTADLVVYNANVYTVDSSFSTAQAFAIKKDEFIAIGSNDDIRAKYKNAGKIVNANGAYIYPGIIDAHCHFTGYALSAEHLKLWHCKSFSEVLAATKAYADTNKFSWIIGRGWNQNAWANKNFPTNEALNKMYPNKPVYLQRIDGHAAICNNAALALAGITEHTTIFGGEFVKDKNGKLTGLLIDNASHLVENILPKPEYNKSLAFLKKAQQECFELGVTSVVDCGVEHTMVQWVQQAYQKSILDIRIDLLLTDDSTNKSIYLSKPPIHTKQLSIVGFKCYADGALGSRGGLMISPYSDRPNYNGLLLTPLDSMMNMASKLAHTQYQMCTHAIGDSANRLVLDMYNKVLQPHNNKRWRIEHAQVVHPADIIKYKQGSIIPSTQPTHATSDMPWALERLGPTRLRYAYANKSLLEANGWLPLGTDFPVEYINPFYTFYSAVFRIYDTTKPAFNAMEALTREQALKGITIWAAKSTFQEKTRGSIEVGKLADFVISNTNLMQAEPQACKQAKVTSTYIGGKCVYSQ